MHTKTTDTKRTFIEITLCFILMAAVIFFMNLLENFLPVEGRLSGVLVYLIPCVALIFYILKAEKAPLSSIGLVFRGFLLHKTLSLCGSKILSAAVNILLFYAIHFSSMQFVFGEFYNIATNVIILCAYLFLSRRRSIVPLMIAHGFYDTLTSVLLPLFLYLLGK